MKLIVLTFFISALTLSTSVKENIIGKWKLIDSEDNTSIEFKMDNTSEMIFYSEGNAFSVKGQFSIVKDSVLFLKYGKEIIEEHKIKKLNSNTLILKYKEEFSKFIRIKQ